MKFFIDTHKGATVLVMLALMIAYTRWRDATAWVYLSLHGTYGLLWAAKSRLFPDRDWAKGVSWLFGVVVIWGGLTTYWVAGWIVFTRSVVAPGWLLGLGTFLFSVGVFFHFGADMQKFTALAARPDALITIGFFRLSRNPNYFGELLIYLGFSLLAMHWLPIAILAVWVGGGWIPRMIRKDRSLARYSGFAEYKRRTRMLVPFVV